MNAEQLAQFFHGTYERLAPTYGYKTQEATAVPWADVPESNKRLMIAVAREVLKKLEGEERVNVSFCGGCGRHHDNLIIKDSRYKGTCYEYKVVCPISGKEIWVF